MHFRLSLSLSLHSHRPKNQGNSSSQQKGNQKRQQGAQDNEKEKRDDAQGHGILADKGEEGDKNSDGEDADEEGDIGLPESMFLNPELDMLKQSIQEDKRANKEDDTLTLEKLGEFIFDFVFCFLDKPVDRDGVKGWGGMGDERREERVRDKGQHADKKAEIQRETGLQHAHTHAHS